MTDRLHPVAGDDGLLVVRGGVGGIRFQWEELEEAATVLAVLAADTGDVAVALGYLDHDLGEFPWRIMHLQPTGGVAGPLYQAARADLDAAWTSALDSGRTLATTGNRLRASLRAYRAADGAAVAATEAARATSGATARAAARAAIERGVLDVGPIALRNRSAGAVVPFDGTVAGVVGRLAAVESEEPGTFEVLRAGTDAAPVYVVVLPGTQSGLVDGAAGSNPFDAGGIAEALAAESRFTEGAVLEALRRAGAEQGDPLVMAGYSQGGLHAVNLATSEGLGGRYDVRVVLTAGSPTGWHESGSAEYLHLEHHADAVPELDSTDNADGRNRTTVTLGHPVPVIGTREDGSRESWGLGPAHKLENYAEGARLIDDSQAPSLAPAAALLATAGASGTARRYSFTAVRNPQPAEGPGARGTRGVQQGGSRLLP
ncbi:hypothetical protein FDK12_05510 [Arthrobacter sp. NamB2]|uniref:hypothetical protein n=1 Tax=Arthrobacter sp. NamB2 TaxID=2576035 RepID=UPI0010C9F967|nr:hypothetical protein [Arthrobacter sp. NamB2]TKV29106.1 hypothetical protein FDK12_05510 [Arthrobacter sp. NamB2]